MSTLEQRFWAKVDLSGECWVWTGATARAGYGKIWDGHRIVAAHRLSYEWANGPIPAGLFVCHTCDNPPCVRPEHLFAGTSADNSRDMLAKARHPYEASRRRAPALAAAMLEMAKAGMAVRPIARLVGLSRSAVWSTLHEAGFTSPDAVERGRAKTACKRGHPLSGDNLSPYGLRIGKRLCLECGRAKQRAYKAQRHK